MHVKKSEYRLFVTLDVTQPVPSKMLDQSGFPWEFAFGTEAGQVGLKPLRNNPPTWADNLWDYEERLPVAQRTRVLDYMSQLEACDWPIKAVHMHADEKVDMLDSIPRVLDPTPSMGKVMIEAGGFTWGPLPITPLEVPLHWPFPGVIRGAERTVTIEPTGGNRVDVVSRPNVPPPVKTTGDELADKFSEDVEKTLGVTGGGVRINLEWGEALAFALSAAEMGWERAVALHFPRGLRLGVGMPIG
jgi:hypothetical protein